MDVNKPIENPVLVELLDNLKTQFNADTEHKFFKELLSAKFLSPITQEKIFFIGAIKFFFNLSVRLPSLCLFRRMS